MPGGALAVRRGRRGRAARQRAHPTVRPCRGHAGLASAGHASFASTHAAAALRDEAARLWRADPVARPLRAGNGGRGAPPGARGRRVLFSSCARACTQGVDSYSAFVEADGRTTTGLAALLAARGTKRVFCCGLATDFCVGLQRPRRAERQGFDAFVVEDACRAIDAGGSLQAAWARMNAAGVRRIVSGQILARPGGFEGGARFSVQRLAISMTYWPFGAGLDPTIQGFQRVTRNSNSGRATGRRGERFGPGVNPAAPHRAAD